MTPLSVEEIVRLFGLKPHLEGGYFHETYRSAGRIESLDRNFGTAILYLLPEGTKSRLHRLRSDELWHFHLGGPLKIGQIFGDGRIGETILGPDVRAGQKVQHTVEAGCWLGAAPLPGAGYSFVGCTVSPGFDFADWEIGKRPELLRDFPSARRIIESLTD